MRTLPRHLSRLAAVATLSMMCVAGAAVLPDDRADLFWSKYKGGGMDITGQSVLVRKKFSEKFSVEANYFVDKVSGASVDVLSQASVIKDERKQKSLSVDYIHDKTQYNLSYTNSTERDYISNTTHFSLSQDMFGDLTTVTLGFTTSRNKVGEYNKPAVAWLGHATSRSYEGGLSQVITKNLIAGVTLEIITDQGFLSNPYRPIRYRVDPSINPLGYALGTQVYPNTRTTTAVETRAKYYLPYRAAASVSYRYFRDTWGIKRTPSSWGTRNRSPTRSSSRAGCGITARTMRISTAISFPSRARRTSRAGPESRRLDQQFDRRENDLGLRARRLPNFQARHRYR